MWVAFANTEDFPNLGHQALDDEHHNIVRLLNELHAAILQRSAITEQRRLLHQLEAYVRVNNRSEEEMMDADLYPSREIHHKAHEAMYRKLSEYAKVLQAGREDESLHGLHAIRELFIHHVSHEDSRVANWHRIRNISDNSPD